MTLNDVLDLMRKYSACPKCGCDTVGAGSGRLDINSAAGYFRRSCQCGWWIEIREGKFDDFDGQ